MQPELNEYNQGSDIVLVDRFSVTKPTFTKPERGDVVIFRSPEDARKTCVKRVVGVEGDSVIPRAGGKIHYYDRSEDPFQDEHVPVYIPKGYCWVEGDNAPFSKDSNAYGAVSHRT
jgi:signal peptidase I